MDKNSFKKQIQTNIERHGYHVTIVGAAAQPRFAYTIGVFEKWNFELVFPGGIYFTKDEILRIFARIVSNLTSSKGVLSKNLVIDGLGEFSFLHVHQSWVEIMLLGVADYYSKRDVPTFQIMPDLAHFTLDIPDMTMEWSLSSQPVWQWLKAKWSYNLPKSSTVATNIQALQGEAITELTRWEENEWEMFAGPGPDVQEKDMRVVHLATLLGIDHTLLPAIDLQIGDGLWRTDKESEWQNWK